MDPVLEWLLGELERATKKIEKDSADAWRHVTCLCGLPSELNRARADIEAIQGGVEGLSDLVREARQRVKERRVAA